MADGAGCRYGGGVARSRSACSRSAGEIEMDAGHDAGGAGRRHSPRRSPTIGTSGPPGARLADDLAAATRIGDANKISALFLCLLCSSQPGAGRSRRPPGRSDRVRTWCVVASSWRCQLDPGEAERFHLPHVLGVDLRSAILRDLCELPRVRPCALASALQRRSVLLQHHP